MLERVDPRIRLHGPARELGVALDHGLDRVGELDLGEPAHLGDRVVELIELLIVGLDDMLGGHLPLLPSCGQRPDPAYARRS